MAMSDTERGRGAFIQVHANVHDDLRPPIEACRAR